MEAVWYTSTRGKYLLRDCTEEDIEDHFSKVEDALNDMVDDEYIDRMRLSVSEGRARCVEKDGEVAGFIYTIVSEPFPFHLTAVSLVSYDLVATSLLLVSCNMRTYRGLVYMPHSVDNLRSMKGLFTSQQIKWWASKGKEIRVKSNGPVVRKVFKMFKLFNIRRIK